MRTISLQTIESNIPICLLIWSIVAFFLIMYLTIRKELGYYDDLYNYPTHCLQSFIWPLTLVMSIPYIPIIIGKGLVMLFRYISIKRETR